MFDARTLELFKAHTHVNGEITIESFTEYINKYHFIYVGLAMSHLTQG
jgi:hypothetical protein